MRLEGTDGIGDLIAGITPEQARVRPKSGPWSGLGMVWLLDSMF